jgi:hypothetical protein
MGRQVSWFYGALDKDNKQRAAVVIAESREEALRYLKAASFRVTLGQLKDYWLKNPPRHSDNMSPDYGPGVYLAMDMNYPRVYALEWRAPMKKTK